MSNLPFEFNQSVHVRGTRPNIIHGNFNFNNHEFLITIVVELEQVMRFTRVHKNADHSDSV